MAHEERISCKSIKECNVSVIRMMVHCVTVTLDNTLRPTSKLNFKIFLSNLAPAIAFSFFLCVVEKVMEKALGSPAWS